MKKRGLILAVLLLLFGIVIAIQITTFTNNLSEETLNFTIQDNYTRNLSIWRNPSIDYAYLNLDGRFRLSESISIENNDGQTLSTDYDGNTIVRKNNGDVGVFDIFHENGTFRKNLTLDSTYADYISIAIEEDIFWINAQESGSEQMMYEYDYYGNRISSKDTGSGIILSSKYYDNSLWVKKSNKLERWDISRTYSESILNIESSYGNFYGLSIGANIIYQLDDLGGTTTRINKYNMNGSLIEYYTLNYGGNGGTPGIDVGDDIIITSDTNDIIVRLNLDGDYLENYSLNIENQDPWGIARIDNNMYVVDDSDNKIYSYYENGTVLGNCSLDEVLDYRGMASIGDYLYISLASSIYDIYKVDKNCNFIKYIDLNSSSGSFFHGIDYYSGKYYSSKLFGSTYNISETTPSSSIENTLNLIINNMATFDIYEDNIWVMFLDGRLKNYPVEGNILEGDYTNTNFTTQGNRGIASNGTYIWSLNYLSDMVYTYTMDGTDTGESFNTYSGNSNPADITTDNNYIFITDNNDKGYYKYHINGTYTENFTSLSSEISSIYGIATDGLNIYASNAGGAIIYKYTMAGVYTGTSYDLSTSLSSIWAIETNGTYIWIADNTENKIYKFTIGGSYLDSFSLDSGNTYPYGILVNGENILVNDYADRIVYVYNQIDSTYQNLMNTPIVNNTFVDLSIVGDEIWLFNDSTNNYTNYNLYSVSSTKLEIGEIDGSYEVNINGRLYGSQKTSDLGTRLMEILNYGDCDCSNCELNESNNNCIIPFTFFGAEDIMNYSNINISYDIKPYVQLVSPSNNTVSSSQKTFNCSSVIDSSLVLDNITLQIWNSSGVLLNESTKSTSTNSDYLEFAQGFIYEDDYHWGCFSYSNESIISYSKNNYTISVFTNITAIQTLYPYGDFIDTSSLILNYTAEHFTKEIDSCSLWGNFSGSWEQNQTDTSVLNGGINNFSLVIEDGHYNWNIKCIDNTSVESFSEYNRTFTVDTILPNITINSISTTEGSQTISFSPTVIDANVGTCKYSIYDNGTIDGLNENISFNCNTVKSATVTSYGTFTLRIYSQDLAENENYEESLFITTASSEEGGGGGGTTVVKPANWTMETATDVTTYDISIPAGTSDNKNIQFVNTGEIEIAITLSCEDINGTMCQYVTFKEESFDLLLVKDSLLRKTFTITLPSDIEKGRYQFNIIATDQDGSTQFITATISTGGEDLLVETLSKLSKNTEEGVPYLLIFIPALLLSLVISTKFMPKTPVKFLLVLGISGFFSLLPVYLL